MLHSGLAPSPNLTEMKEPSQPSPRKSGARAQQLALRFLTQ